MKNGCLATPKAMDDKTFFPFPMKSKAAGPLLASKYLKIAALLSLEEMEEVVSGGVFFADISSLIVGKARFDKAALLEKYAFYLSQLKVRDKVETLGCYAISDCAEAFYGIDVGKGRIKLCSHKPSIQVRSFAFAVCEKQLISHAFGKKSVAFGVEFSFPRVYQDASGEIQDAVKVETYPNYPLARNMFRLLRALSLPVRFEGYKTAPFRLGKGYNLREHKQLSMLPLTLSVAKSD